MTISKIRLRGLSNIDLPIVGAQPTDLYICKGVDGLGPPEVDVRIANTLHQGGVYQGRHALTRELVITVGLNPNYTTGQRPADLRKSLYGLLTPGEDDYVMVEIHRSDGEVWSTKAWVKRMETAIFSKDPAVQIVLPCLQPYLTSPSMTTTPPADKTNFTVTNHGSAPTGFVFQFFMTANMNTFSLSSPFGDRKIQIDYPFAASDQVIISTVPGDRYIRRIRTGESLEIAGYLSAASQWMMLRGGQNVLTASTSNYTWISMTHVPNHWGI